MRWRNTVVTMTSKVNGKTGILTPCRSDTPENFTTKIGYFWLRREVQHARQILRESDQRCSQWLDTLTGSQPHHKYLNFLPARTNSWSTSQCFAAGETNKLDDAAMYSGSQTSPLRFSDIFSQTVGNFRINFFTHLLHAPTIVSTLDYKFLFNISNFDEVMPY